MPDAPDGTTVIVWNWHWSCNGAPPPPASVTGATVCVACNIAVSVRIASPGDTGDVVQQIGAAAAAAVKGIEAAAQAAAPVAPPAVELPALSAAPDAAPAEPVPALPVESAPTEVAAAAPEDAPRRGAPLTYGAPAGWHEPVVKRSTAAPSILAPSSIKSSSASPAALERAAPAVEHARPARAAAAPRPRAPLPVPSSPVPSDPLPAVLSVGQLSGHGEAGSASAALTTMTLAGLLLVFLSRVRSIARPRRRAGPVTQPDPPG